MVRSRTVTSWARYYAAAGVGIDIHQLRHAHATELINAGVSIEAVRRLGHASTETTQLYTLLDDQVADAEIRAAVGAVTGPRGPGMT
jgi:integrase/recombinase XerD